MKKNIIVLLFFFLNSFVNAQDPHFSQALTSPLTLNPALAGKFDGLYRLSINHKTQWPTIPKAYETTSLSFDFPILQQYIKDGDVMAIGVSGVSDASASNILKLNYGSLSCSFQKAFDETQYNTIGIGIQATYASTNIDVGKLNFEDELDQNGFYNDNSAEFSTLSPINSQRNYFDLNAGILFSGSTNGENNLYLGYSMYHLNQPKLSFRNTAGNKDDWYLSGRSCIHAGGSFPVGRFMTISFSAINQFQNTSSETVFGGYLFMPFSINIKGEKPAGFSFGTSYRLKDALIPYIGLDYQNLSIGFSYDINISKINSITNTRGGAEVSLILLKTDRAKKLIPCPSLH